jgi:putative colanic acid biosynthesis acetyltransferase WcaF
LKVNLASFNNNWYKQKSGFKGLLWYIVSILFFKNALFPFYGFKVFLLELFGASIGENVLIKPNVNIKYPWLLSIGNNVWIGEQVWIDNLAKVTIGNDVCISQGALLLCGNHNYKKISFDLMVGEIILEDGVWICAKAIVTQNVLCKNHSIVSTGSVLTSNTDDYGIYSGNPAVKIKNRTILS